MPDAEPPECINARISIQGIDEADERGCRNVLLLLTTSENSNSLLSKYREQVHDQHPDSSPTLLNAKGEILSTIHKIYMMLITDTQAFIEGAVEQINGFVGGLFGSFISIISCLRMATEVQRKT